MPKFFAENKKKIVAICAIVLAAALIAASVVVLAKGNASSDEQNVQNEQVMRNQNVSGTSTSVTSENVEQKASEDAKQENKEEAAKNNTSYTSSEANNAALQNSAEQRDSGTVPSASGTVPSDATDTSRTVPSDQSQAESDINVYITIDDAGHGNASYAGNVTLDEGASVYDALMATGVSVNARDSQYGTYVAAIGGLAEKSAGGESGWKYSVNGVEPQTACSNYKLKSGDVVKWKFVTKASESVG